MCWGYPCREAKLCLALIPTVFFPALPLLPHSGPPFAPTLRPRVSSFLLPGPSS